MRRRVCFLALLALSLTVVSANAVTEGWSNQQCKAAAVSWARHHPTAGNAPITAYLKKLTKLHGCHY
jgi:hypothetical protein